MLHRALKVSRAVTHLYNIIISPDVPSLGQIDDRDWLKTKAIRRILHAFLRPTEHLSGSYYPTSNCVLPHLVEITDVLQKHKNIEGLQGTVDAMTTKLRQYFVPFPSLFYVATLVDPQWKFDGAKQLLIEFYRNCDLPDPVSEAEKHHQHKLNKMKDLYRHHRAVASSRDQAQAMCPSTNRYFGGMFKRSRQIR